MSTAPYVPTEKLYQQIDRAFSPKAPELDALVSQVERGVEMRGFAKSLALLICHLTPASREQSVALTKLEEVVMWAGAAMARNE